jgi:hypothetical protein
MQVFFLSSYSPQLPVLGLDLRWRFTNRRFFGKNHQDQHLRSLQKIGLGKGKLICGAITAVASADSPGRWE